MERAEQKERDSTQGLQQARGAQVEAEAAQKEASKEASGLQAEAEQLREAIAQDDQHVQVLRSWKTAVECAQKYNVKNGTLHQRPSRYGNPLPRTTSMCRCESACKPPSI